jgi:hypothetical protein
MSKTTTTLDGFKSYIKTLTIEELNDYGKDLEQKIKNARSPSVKLGYSMGIDAILIEIAMREISQESLEMSDDELLAELLS